MKTTQKAIYFITKRCKFCKICEANTLNGYILLQKYRKLLKLVMLVKEMDIFLTKRCKLSKIGKLLKKMQKDIYFITKVIKFLNIKKV